MDDPIITNPFLKKVIKARKQDIIGVATSSRSRLHVSKKSKLEYLFCLFFILGPVIFFENILKSLIFKMSDISWSLLGRYSPFSLLYFSKNLGIKTYKDVTPNSKYFKEILKKLDVDLVINQSQNILTKDFISIPKIGVINRHNSLLPRHKGRISPFWVLKNRDKFTGVSIHYVDSEVDNGDIIFQFKYETLNYGFSDLVKINYKIAPVAMLKSIDMIEHQTSIFQVPDSATSNYNSTPTLSDLIHYLKMKKYKKWL